jgi:hypothetical protein
MTSPHTAQCGSTSVIEPHARSRSSTAGPLSLALQRSPEATLRSEYGRRPSTRPRPGPRPAAPGLARALLTPGHGLRQLLAGFPPRYMTGARGSRKAPRQEAAPVVDLHHSRDGRCWADHRDSAATRPSAATAHPGPLARRRRQAQPVADWRRGAPAESGLGLDDDVGVRCSQRSSSAIVRLSGACSGRWPNRRPTLQSHASVDEQHFHSRSPSSRAAAPVTTYRGVKELIEGCWLHVAVRPAPCRRIFAACWSD